VGCSASRILAEAALIPIDSGLLAHGIPYVRFVDDYRIFANSYSEAHKYLRILTDLLDREGLYINTQKTSLFDITHTDAELDNPNETQPHSFVPIDTDEKILKTRLTGGLYGTKISRFYVYPGREAIERMSKIDLQTEVANIEIERDTDEKQLREVVKAIIYRETDRTSLLFRVLYRYPHLATFVCDAITREISKFDDIEKDFIRKTLLNLYDESGSFHRLSIGRVLLCSDLRTDQISTKLIGELPLSDANLFVRFFAGFVRGHAPRSVVRSLKDRYSHVGLTARREIVELIAASDIASGEKKAWFRNIRTQETDELLVARITFHLKAA
jgi:hypothetical protein